MNCKIILSTVSLALLFGACKDKKDEPEKLDFSCIRIYDEQGLGLGIYGCDTNNDWTNIELSSEEAAYFDGTVDLTGTTPTTINGIAFFPNPVFADQPFSIHLLGDAPYQKVNLQLAFINESKEVLDHFNLLLNSDGSVDIGLPASKFPAGAYYRMYYRVSAEGAPVLLEGYGNFIVCDQPGFNSECLR